MDRFDYDLVVLGGGSGGVRAARVAARSGARVVIVEEYRYGGTCVIRGCVPKKLFVYASHLGDEIADAVAFGWQVEKPRFDWATLVANKDREIARLSSIYQRLLGDAGVEMISGRGVVVDPHTVEVDGKRLTARVILIATGATPFVPAIPGAELAVTSNEAFHLPTLPRRVTVVGGGYIAVEFAHIFAGLGCEVSLVHRGTQVLRGFDLDVRAEVTAGLAARNVALHLETTVEANERNEQGLSLRLATGQVLHTDLALVATGRLPNTAGLGLLEAGVACDDKGAVVVDELSRSSVESIYAVGDVTNRVNLTPIAIREGQAFADTVFGGRPTPVQHRCIPTAVFSIPPAASVGLTEEAARSQYEEVDVYRAHFRPLKHTLTGRSEKVLMKLIVERQSDRVLGVHMVGLDAAEIIQAAAIPVLMGATKAQFDATVAVHPTTAEELVLMRQPS